MKNTNRNRNARPSNATGNRNCRPPVAEAKPTREPGTYFEASTVGEIQAHILAGKPSIHTFAERTNERSGAKVFQVFYLKPSGARLNGGA